MRPTARPLLTTASVLLASVGHRFGAVALPLEPTEGTRRRRIAITARRILVSSNFHCPSPALEVGCATSVSRQETEPEPLQVTAQVPIMIIEPPLGFQMHVRDPSRLKAPVSQIAVKTLRLERAHIPPVHKSCARPKHEK